MSTINDILIAVANMAQVNGLYADIAFGALPLHNGLCMALSAGRLKTTTLEKTLCYELTVVLNGKHASQQTVSDTLNDIHTALTQVATYPATAAYQITDIATIALPVYIGRDAGGQWLYGSSLLVRAYVF